MMMRTLAVTTAVFAFALSVRGEEPRAVIERAVKAMGGDVDPARNPAVLARFTVKGRVFPIAGAGEVYYQSVTTLRADVNIEFNTEKHSARLVIDGNKGWLSADGRVEEMPANEAPQVQAMLRFCSPVLLPSLLADRGGKLTALPDGVFQGRPTRVVRASLNDKIEAELHFDKESGLLVSKSLKMADMQGNEVVLHLLNYREPGAGAAVRALKEAGVGTDGPALLAFLRKHEPDPAKVAQAAVLVKRLGDDDFDTREKAAEDLVALGGLAVPHLERALKDKDAEVVRRAQGCLELIAKQNDGRVVAAALHQVVTARVEGGTEALLRLLPGASAATARELKAALVVVAERDGKPDAALLKALEDRDPSVRAAAEAVLGKDGGAYLKQPGRRLYSRGIKQPMTLKLIQGGQEFVEMEITEMQFFNAFDPKLFVKP